MTTVNRERCEGCGFVWDDLTRDALPPRLVAAASRISSVLTSAASPAQRREPGRWSSVEYAAHVRDVAYLVRGRIIRAIIETEPQSPPLYREERVNLGFYANDVPELLAHEVENAASLLVRTLAAISDEQLTRTLHYGYPDASIRTVLWTFAQALHEFEHHGDDIVENEERLGR